MLRNPLWIPALACSLLFSVEQTASAAWTQTIDDSQAEFSTFNGDLKTAIDPTAYGGSYHYIDNWGDSDNASGIVRYQLSNVPAGLNLFSISFSSPADSKFGTPGSVAQWHIFDVAADGTTQNDQLIPWAGQFGTNKQWLGTNSGYNPGGFTTLGPGPQNDQSLGDGNLVWINGSSGLGTPYIYIKYQPWYNAPIAFDAITVTMVPEPSSIALSGCGMLALGMVARRRRRAQASQAGW